MPTALSILQLRQIPLFRGLNETECRQIFEIVQTRSFAPKELIIRQGETSRNLWVVLEGTCEVRKRIVPETSGDEAVVLAVLEPYSYFGEMSFFHPAEHSADVCARTAVTVLQIARSDYQDLIAEGVWAAYKLAYNVVEGLAERLRRMDDWLSELVLRHKETVQQIPEWSEFRERLFNGWTMPS